MNENKVMDWNDSIQEDSIEYALLPEGEYNFVVTNFERSRFPGGPKVPPCNKAIITVQVQTDNGTANVRFDLLLYRTLEWRISAFFRCIGQKKSGEKLVMNWNNVIGSMGRAHFRQKTYVNNNGEEKVINELDRFIDYNPDFFVNVVSDDDLPFNNELSFSNKNV